MKSLPLDPSAVVKVVRELRRSANGLQPIALGGARLLVDALRRELVRDGDPAAVREGSPEGAAALVYVMGGELTEEDERALREADFAGVPIVVLGPDPRTPVPYVLATDVLPLRPGEGFPLDELGRLLARKAGDAAVPLAARLPAIRRSVAEALVEQVARQNGLIAAAVFIPGVDFPVITLNQLRLVLKLATVYGQELDATRIPEVVGVIASGLGLRAFARRTAGVIPFARWAVQGGVSYTGTHVLGEAAIRYFELRGGGAKSRAAGADRT